MKATILSWLLMSTVSAFGAGAIKYQTLNEATSSQFYRLTCSDTKGIQAHVYIVVEKDEFTALKIVTIANAESLLTLDYSREDLKKLKLTASANRLEITGSRPGAYYDEEFSLTVQEGKGGSWSGKLYYDSHDGMTLDRAMKCGAVNYILAPSR